MRWRRNWLLTPRASFGCPTRDSDWPSRQKLLRNRFALLNATQRPLAVACIQERSSKPAWIDKPSWYLIAEEDRMIPLATQRYLAHRMKARVRSERLDHTPLVTAPDTVVEVILDAVSQ